MKQVFLFLTVIIVCGLLFFYFAPKHKEENYQPVANESENGETHQLTDQTSEITFEDSGKEVEETENSDTSPLTDQTSEIVFEGLIKEVRFDNCNILATSSNGKVYTLDSLAGTGMKDPECIEAPKYAISDTGKYLVFEDVSGGVDLWVRVFSVSTQSLDTLGVWGTSWLLGLKFLPNDKIAILSGYPDIPKDQWLTLYDLPSLYKDYPKGIDTNKYFKYDHLEKDTIQLPIDAVPGDWFELYRDEENLTLYGGTKTKPIMRGTFPLSAL